MRIKAGQSGGFTAALRADSPRLATVPVLHRRARERRSNVSLQDAVRRFQRDTSYG